jgi:hypothetical protein
MPSEPENRLTVRVASASGNADRNGAIMDSAEEKQWSKRYAWAVCREPYKTQLDTLGSHWIEGTLSNESLAFEAIQLLSHLDWIRRPSQGISALPMQDVIIQVQIITEAMLAASLHPEMTPDLRREALDFMRSEFSSGKQIDR